MAGSDRRNSSPGDGDGYEWCIDYPLWPNIWSALSVVTFLLGFPASVWVLHELLQRQRRRSTGDIFILSLCVLDLTFTIHILFSVTNFMLWRIAELGVVLDFIYNLSLFGRPLLMACMCWDCYMAVVHPIIYKTSKKLIMVKKVLIITVCLMTVALGAVLVFDDDFATTPFMATSLFLALPVITVCDISILRALRKPDPTGKTTIHPQKKQALHTVSTSLIMTLVVYLPPGIIFSFANLVPLRNIEIFCNVVFPAYCLSMTGCGIMPVLYLITQGKMDGFKNWWTKSST